MLILKCSTPCCKGLVLVLQSIALSKACQGVGNALIGQIGWKAPVAMYASSMATQSLKSRSTKMECSRFDTASSVSAQGGTTCTEALP